MTQPPTLRAPRGARRRLSDTSGVTLIEALVALTTGTVLMLALFAILDFSTTQTSRTTDLVQATQLGRNAMSHIIDELRSACLATEGTPIGSGSTGSTLIFENAFSESPVIPKESAYERRIVWSSTEKNGTLVESTWNATGGSWPSFTFPATSSTPNSTVLLAEDVSQAKVGASGAEETLPIFKYYKYSTTPGAVETNKSLSTLTAVSPPSETTGFTATEAAQIAAVQVNFRAAPVDNSSALGRRADVSGQVTFAFSAPNAESTITDGPCQ
jgi:Tfp pilus assembly protein PilW